jgi:hypothetical protein
VLSFLFLSLGVVVIHTGVVPVRPNQSYIFLASSANLCCHLDGKNISNWQIGWCTSSTLSEGLSILTCSVGVATMVVYKTEENQKIGLLPVCVG